MNNHAVIPLLKLVHATSTETRLNSLKALTLLAEAPEGREALQHYVSEIEERIHDIESKAVARAAEIAVKVITWKP